MGGCYCEDDSGPCHSCVVGPLDEPTTYRVVAGPEGNQTVTREFTNREAAITYLSYRVKANPRRPVGWFDLQARAGHGWRYSSWVLP